MWATSTRSDSAQYVFTTALLGLAAIAWLALAVWGASPYARFLDHGELAHTGLPDLQTLGLMMAGWTLMCVAMMLPTSLPLVTIFRALIRHRADRWLLVLLLVAGYLLIWAAFGVVAHLADWALHQAVNRSFWLLLHAWLISVGALAVAGLYQFTPLKYHCLDECRSPFSFVLTRLHGQHRRWETVRLGLDHGLYCLGCCWPLMLLMFLVGMSNLGWMLLLSAVMATEKNLPWGRRLVAPVGIVLLLGAGGLLWVNLG